MLDYLGDSSFEAAMMALTDEGKNQAIVDTAVSMTMANVFG